MGKGHNRHIPNRSPRRIEEDRITSYVNFTNAEVTVRGIKIKYEDYYSIKYKGNKIYVLPFLLEASILCGSVGSLYREVREKLGDEAFMREVGLLGEQKYKELKIYEDYPEGTLELFSTLPDSGSSEVGLDHVNADLWFTMYNKCALGKKMTDAGASVYKQYKTGIDIAGDDIIKGIDKYSDNTAVMAVIITVLWYTRIAKPAGYQERFDAIHKIIEAYAYKGDGGSPVMRYLNNEITMKELAKERLKKDKHDISMSAYEAFISMSSSRDMSNENHAFDVKHVSKRIIEFAEFNYTTNGTMAAVKMFLRTGLGDHGFFQYFLNSYEESKRYLDEALKCKYEAEICVLDAKRMTKKVEKEVDNKDKEIERLKKQLKDKEEENGRLKKLVEDNEVIKGLRVENDKLNNRVHEISKICDELVEENTEKCRQLSSMCKTNKKLKAMIENYDVDSIVDLSCTEECVSEEVISIENAIEVINGSDIIFVGGNSFSDKLMIRAGIKKLRRISSSQKLNNIHKCGYLCVLTDYIDHTTYYKAKAVAKSNDIEFLHCSGISAVNNSGNTMERIMVEVAKQIISREDCKVE